MRSGPRKRVVVTRCAEAGARPSSDSIGQAGKLGVEAPTHWTAVRVAPGPGLLQPPTPPSSNPGNKRVAVAELNTATRTAGERRVAARRSPRKVICSRVEPSATDEAQLGIVRALTFHRHVSIMPAPTAEPRSEHREARWPDPALYRHVFARRSARECASVSARENWPVDRCLVLSA